MGSMQRVRKKGRKAPGLPQAGLHTEDTGHIRVAQKPRQVTLEARRFPIQIQTPFPTVLSPALLVAAWWQGVN